ncbi:aminoglycoside phosphotransferase family protein [Streptomyces scabiei]|nr:aminoglycoside phosphotransferase family protein [Streptomyces sp. LBUM 1475]
MGPSAVRPDGTRGDTGGRGRAGAAGPGGGGAGARKPRRTAAARRRHVQHGGGAAPDRRHPADPQDPPAVHHAPPGLRERTPRRRGRVLPGRRDRRRPRPRVVAAALDESAPAGRHLLLTHCPGGDWGALEPAQKGPVRRELGGLVARLHRVTGPGFGYPSGTFGPLAADWRTAFAAIYDGVLADARRFRAWLPLPVDEVARTARTAYDALDDVTVPRLVHFDLWQGNILVEPGRTPRVGGLIDGERMFWGDPVADLVSLALLDDIRRDDDFLTGYQETGGEIDFTPSARRRYALYRSYLYLIMLVEVVPRALDDGDVAWRRESVAPRLTAALEELRALS